MEIEDIELKIKELQNQLKAIESSTDPTDAKSTSWVEMTLKGGAANITTERQDSLIGAVAGILNLNRDQIVIFKLGSDSIISLPTDAAERLVMLHKADEPAIHSLGIQQVRIIELNFGKSEYVTYGPISDLYTEPDMSIQIPTEGTLESLSHYEKDFLDFGEAEVKVYSLTPKESLESFVTLEFPLNHDEFDFDHKAILLWVNKREEWVVLIYRRWLESGARKDEYYAGPYELNDYCQRKILQAYRIPEIVIAPRAVVSIDPEQLTKIGDRINRAKMAG